MDHLQHTRLRRRADQPMLLASGGKAGGGAKTSILLATASLALLAGLRVGIIDADADGTLAISSRVRHPDVTVVQLDFKQPLPELIASLAGCDLILFDVGANELTKEATLVPLIRLANYVGGRHGNAGMLITQIPHKANILNDMERAVEALGDLLNMHIMQQNVDNTGAFDSLGSTLAALPRHAVPHLRPTVLTMALPDGWLPADFIRNGLPGYERLRGVWAAHLLRIASSNHFAQWLGIDNALPLLEHVARAGPRRALPDNVSAVQLTDDFIDGWASVRDAHDLIMAADTDTDIVTAVRRYRMARTHVNEMLA